MTAKKHKSVSDNRFNMDDTPITSPWRSYNKFNKYDESFPIKVYELMSSGKTIAQTARELQCSVQTLKRWMAEIEELGEAVELGYTNFQANIEDKLEGALIAEDNMTELPDTNTKLLETFLKSQLPETYSEKHSQKDDKESVDGASALLELIQQTDRLSMTAQTGEQTLTIEKNQAEPMKIVEPK